MPGIENQTTEMSDAERQKAFLALVGCITTDKVSYNKDQDVPKWNDPSSEKRTDIIGC